VLSDERDGPPHGEPPRAIERWPGLEHDALTMIPFPIAIWALERPGTTIDRLEGFIPLQVAMRRPDPLNKSPNAVD
jgi:hypothetical protein